MFTHKTKIIYTAKTTTTRKPDTTTESLDYIPQEEQSGQESLRRSARETPITPPARLPLSRTRRSFVEVIDIPDVVVMKRK